MDVNQRIFHLFKAQARRLLAQGQIPSLAELLDYLDKDEGVLPIPALKEQIIHWYDNVFHLAFLRPYLLEDSLNEILLHHHGGCQILGKDKRSVPIENLSPEDYQEGLEVLARRHHIDWNYRQAMISFFAHLEGRFFRATLCHKGLGPQNISKLFLRHIRSAAFPLEAFHLPSEAAILLERFIKERHNLIIAGATGSGKTSLMRSLLELIPKNEHLVIIEDTHELRLVRPHTTSLLGQPGEAGKELTDYCAHALRMSPDRVVLGEMRSREVLPFALSMNIGHKGMMSTLHANSAADSLSRLCLLFCLYQNTPMNYPLVMKLLCQGIDAIIYMKDRQVTEIIKVLGSEGETPYFEYLYRGSEKI